jgi:hypothetical protein
VRPALFIPRNGDALFLAKSLYAQRRIESEYVIASDQNIRQPVPGEIDKLQVGF